MERRDDHPEPGFRQHRPRPPARPAHRHRATGRVVAQPLRRLSVVGAARSTRWRETARCTPSTGRRTARARPCAATSPSRKSSAAAEQALDRLGLTEPVDWVGNAWGGHVGIRLATRTPRLRTLDHHRHAGAGVHAAGRSSPEGWPLVEMYRFTGPNGFIMKQLFESLLGAEAIAAQPDQAETIKASFREADRNGMFHAMRSMMLAPHRHRASARRASRCRRSSCPFATTSLAGAPTRPAAPVRPSQTAASRRSQAPATSHRC